MSPPDTIAEHIEQRLAAFAAIGADPNGRGVHAFFRDEVRALGGTATADSALLLGSHLDTVTHGGRFDGAAGIGVALEALCLARNVLAHPVEIAAFRAEESERFQVGLIGSKAATGTLGKPTAVDRDGIPLLVAAQLSPQCATPARTRVLAASEGGGVGVTELKCKVMIVMLVPKP